MTAEGYDGPARLVLDDGSHVDVDVRLRGAFQPIDGRYHWYGRLACDPVVDAVGTSRTVVIRTPGGSAAGHLSDRDPWGRLRISGTGRPPFDA